MGDAINDGPNWAQANLALRVPWKNPGGDWRDKNDVAQGAAHYATATVAVKGDFSMQCPELVQRLLADNTGIYLRKDPTKGDLYFGNPRLHVVTDAGTFDPPVAVQCWYAQEWATQPGKDLMKSPAIVKFDLSAVRGTVTAATLTLAVHTLGLSPAVISANYLDPPSLVKRSPVVQGIAATVERDNLLASHPDVLVYDDYTDKAKILALGVSPNDPAFKKIEIVEWPEYGLHAARCWALTTHERITNWHHWITPRSNPPKWWQREFGAPNQWTHLFARYLLRTDPKMQTAFNENGMKLPGMAGNYQFGNTPPTSDSWNGTLWHTPPSKSNPYWVRPGIYYAGKDRPNLSGGNVIFADSCMQMGPINCLEQEVKLNDIGIKNGEMRVWLNGVLTIESVGMEQRADWRAAIQDWYALLYHGGNNRFPLEPFYEEISGVCIATRYIGPPKLLLS